MLTEETLSGVLDIVKGILGVKSQNAEIMLTHDGKIVFRVDRSILYVIDTDLFALVHDTAIRFNIPVLYLDDITLVDLIKVYDWCKKPMPLVLREENVTDNEVFKELTTLKSKDGIGYYKVFDQYHNMYKIPMYTGFIKFNKDDKADLEIYDDNMYWINKFIVKKKKINYPIQIYFMTLKLS